MSFIYDKRVVPLNNWQSVDTHVRIWFQGMDNPSLSIDYKAFDGYMTAVTVATIVPSVCGRHEAHFRCASDVISFTHDIDTSQDEESTEMKLMIALISVMIIGFQPPLHLCPAIRRTLYARDDFLNHVLDHDELGAVLKTRLEQLEELLRIGGAEED